MTDPIPEPLTADAALYRVWDRVAALRLTGDWTTRKRQVLDIIGAERAALARQATPASGGLDVDVLARIEYERIRQSYRRLVKPTWEYALMHRSEPWDPRRASNASLGDLVDQCRRFGQRIAREYARLTSEATGSEDAR